MNFTHVIFGKGTSVKWWFLYIFMCITFYRSLFKELIYYKYLEGLEDNLFKTITYFEYIEIFHGKVD